MFKTSWSNSVSRLVVCNKESNLTEIGASKTQGGKTSLIPFLHLVLWPSTSRAYIFKKAKSGRF